MVEFEAIIKRAGEADTAYVEFPGDVQAIYGKNRVKVVAWFDEVEYRGSLVNMGTGCHIIGLTKEIRAKLGKGVGDLVKVKVNEDIEERIIEIPNDLISELVANNMLEVFGRLSFTNRKEFTRWVEESKKQETRLNRIGQAIEKLKLGKKNPFEK